MKLNYYFIQIFKSHYCKLVFLFSLFLTFILTPKKVFFGYYTILGIFFILITSITLTCFIRSVKDKVVLAKANGASLLGIIMVVIGFGALHTCAIGSPVCGASIGAGIIALFFPGLAISFLEPYSLWIIILSLLIQLVALYFMGCYKLTDLRSCAK